jgi:hypothetical protein
VFIISLLRAVVDYVDNVLVVCLDVGLVPRLAVLEGDAHPELLADDIRARLTT